MRSSSAHITNTRTMRRVSPTPVTVTWSCRGCGQSPSSGGQSAPLLVARYSQDGGVSSPRAPRVWLRLPSFQLEIGPVSAADAGPIRLLGERRAQRSLGLARRPRLRYDIHHYPDTKSSLNPVSQL
ncbi:hypothetical protein FJT64_014437 [Amphibalanus amphitrite]|uniref:Uncharacterized protein n=1 Tax=Amphibalanus amphitrite TaxID=1232801 RepID=A0A6A4V1Y9_AMPAM|nr:hypothetical protein FJT64_014437 [Amphibalanus amphitrite]